MNLFKIFLITIFSSYNLCFSYDGPKSAGIEYYDKGNYEIRGFISCRNDKKCKLTVYHQTRRQYSIRLKGKSFLKNMKEGHYISKVAVYTPSLGDNLDAYLLDYPHPISSYTALKNSVTKLSN
mgnify:CR=1 FL=1|tara:strand:+ start:301 stop:669 length:369 start_codon:yes stop_codon:yes gene_type:complete